MPAKKNRARYGINNSTAPSQTINLKPHIINNLTNGTNFNGYSSTNITNNNNNNHYNQHPSSQVKSTSYSIPSTAYSPTVNGTGVNVGTGTITFTAKQQQQLDRNAFLLMLTKDQLKVECRKRGQKTTGTKTELLQRVGFKMSLQQQQQKAAAQNNNGNGSLQRSSPKAKKTNNSTANGTIGGNNNGAHTRKKASEKEQERNERERIVLWLHPIQTIQYSTLESIELMRTYGAKLLENKLAISIIVAVIAVLSAFYHVPGNHQAIIQVIRSNLWFVVYWVGLGVLSSVGLGTGLHTFILYLGPHIASVTLAAYECNSLNFPSPPYPDEIICPEEEVTNYVPSLWSIMSKVRFEAFLWGAGTALGELPPYFMAKASRLSGYDPDDGDDFEEFEELNKKREMGIELSLMERAKIFMERAVEKVGFFGILACASIPNPLFDLAGITCGHFLVPFWTFFGATLLGKAVIKMHIQKVFVIIAFSETLVEKAVDLLGVLPWFGRRLQEPFKAFLQNQKTRLHRSTTKAPAKESKNLIAKLFEYFVIAMIVYFVISIVNSLAQSYHKRIHKKSMPKNTQQKKVSKEKDY